VRLSVSATAAAQALNRCVAALLCDLFDVMDRGVVFELVATYTQVCVRVSCC
jgi:hypothetical protein